MIKKGTNETKRYQNIPNEQKESWDKKALKDTKKDKKRSKRTKRDQKGPIEKIHRYLKREAKLTECVHWI